MKATHERTILADCCEDWIIEWGGFYERGRAFRCPECSTEWTKSADDSYRRGDAREFVRRARSSYHDPTTKGDSRWAGSS